MIIKEWIKECRPPQQFWLEQVSGFAFPSGHAEVGPLLWWGLAYYVRPLWLKTTFILIGLLIGLSRIYLGVHYPQDVFVGFLLGLIVLSLCILVEKKFINSFCGQPV
jgi:membrane-associated phospholipid phosphatase